MEWEQQEEEEHEEQEEEEVEEGHVLLADGDVERGREGAGELYPLPGQDGLPLGLHAHHPLPGLPERSDTNQDLFVWNRFLNLSCPGAEPGMPELSVASLLWA